MSLGECIFLLFLAFLLVNWDSLVLLTLMWILNRKGRR